MIGVDMTIDCHQFFLKFFNAVAYQQPIAIVRNFQFCFKKSTQILVQSNTSIFSTVKVKVYFFLYSPGTQKFQPPLSQEKYAPLPPFFIKETR